MVTLVTGSNGFIGKAITNSLLTKGHNVIAQVRTKNDEFPKNLPQIICDLALISQVSVVENFVPSSLLDGLKKADILIHTAAQAHTFDKSIDELIKVNTFATLKLAEIAAKAGVKRFVFLSTIGVNGAVSKKPFTEEEEIAPHNDYAFSKLEAEKGLQLIAAETDMEIVIIRPPLVYGNGSPGSFGKLLGYVKRTVPLPLGNVPNKRSFISIDNLVDFTIFCSDRVLTPHAANQVFVISDDQDVSTTQLLKKVARAYGKWSLLIPVPVSYMRFFAKLVGKSAQADKLFGDLQIDCSKAKKILGWRPVVTMDEQLEKMADFDRNKK